MLDQVPSSHHTAPACLYPQAFLKRHIIDNADPCSVEMHWLMLSNHHVAGEAAEIRGWVKQYL